MKYEVSKEIVLSQVPEGPIAEHIGSFAKSLSEQGYALCSIHRQVSLAACFSGWLVAIRETTWLTDSGGRELGYFASFAA
jgi:hypothetical protein